uniref:SEA domain-containing protein n=1 Tax=Capra hircus TaxID=9925 RepID=A0A8C2SCD6_CAPHI
MTPDIQAPFSLLLLFQVLTVLTASVPTSPSSTVQVSSTQSSPTSSPTKETSFNSSLENPQTSYYQELKRSILDVILQTYKQRDFLGLSEIKFSLHLGCLAGALPCWCWSAFWLRWPSSISLPWLCVSADERNVSSWTSFQPMPTIL